MKERNLIREFLETMHASPELGHSHEKEEDYSLDSVRPEKHSRHSIDPNRDGIVKQEDLHMHFDRDGDGVVTTDDYRDHIQFHCQYPETLDHYNKLKTKSYESVPCRTSYDSCSQHLMGNADEIDVYLAPLMDATGSTCRTSSVQGLLDVLQSLINCGMLR